MNGDRRAQYNGYAAGYAESAADNVWNARLDRPTVLGLIGDVDGKRVLDAGCGPGLYAEELVGRGAAVVGFGQSADMVALARHRVPASDFRVHDLAEPLDWLPDDAFDTIVLALVLQHVDDRVAALRELHRVLVPGGIAVVSVVHLVKDWLNHGGSYFDRTVVEEQWDDGWRVRWWRQPIADTIGEFRTAGFALDEMVEPRLPASLAEQFPDAYEQSTTGPVFAVFKLCARTRAARSSQP